MEARVVRERSDVYTQVRRAGLHDAIIVLRGYAGTIRPQKNVSLDGSYFFAGLGGNNELKFGFGYRNVTTNSVSSYNGNGLSGEASGTGASTASPKSNCLPRTGSSRSRREASSTMLPPSSNSTGRSISSTGV